MLIYFHPGDPQLFALQRQVYCCIFFLSGMSCVFLLKIFFFIYSSEGRQENKGELRISKHHEIRETKLETKLETKVTYGMRRNG